MKKKNAKLQQYIFRIQLIIIITLAVILGTIGILTNLIEDSKQRDQNLRNVAGAIAASSLIHEIIEQSPSAEISQDQVTGLSEQNTEDNDRVQEHAATDTAALIDYLDTLKDSLSGIDVISAVGQDGVRLYHSNHDLIGKRFDGTIPDFSENGLSYTVNDNGPSGPQRRAYAAICAEDGSIEGYVMTIMLVSSIRIRTFRTLAIFIAVIVAAILLELFISYKISGLVRKRLMGYEPDTLSAMFMIRENTLEALDEGIITADAEGNIQYINNAAASMLGIGKEDLSDGTDNQKQLASRLLGRSLADGAREMAVPLTSLKDADIIIDRIPIQEDGRITGAACILHNRTEYTKLAEDLAGTRFLVDSMRANNHDFTNKLHVIMGLLQMQMYDEAIEYIENISMVQRETISTIMHAVNAPSIAALLIGKTSRASELNVRFMLAKDSSFDRDDVDIPENALVTILGNLIDNALEAMNTLPREAGRELCCGVYSSPHALMITVDDTGPGIAQDDLKKIFDNGFSTKGSGRGTGLFQAKKIIEAFGGDIQVQTQAGAGTSFTVSFTQKERD